MVFPLFFRLSARFSIVFGFSRSILVHAQRLLISSGHLSWYWEDNSNSAGSLATAPSAIAGNNGRRCGSSSDSTEDESSSAVAGNGYSSTAGLTDSVWYETTRGWESEGGEG